MLKCIKYKEFNSRLVVEKHLLVSTPGIFVISTMVIGHEDTLQSMTHYSYVYIKREAIAEWNTEFLFQSL